MARLYLKEDLGGFNMNGVSAKEASKSAQIFAAIWIIVMTIGKSFGVVKLEVQEIIYSGIAIAGIFMPVYFSIWMEKIKDIRFGKQ